MNWPRVTFLLAMTLYYLTRSDHKSEIVLIGVSVCAPFKESEQLRSHDETSDFNVETDQPRVQKGDDQRGRHHSRLSKNSNSYELDPPE